MAGGAPRAHRRRLQRLKTKHAAELTSTAIIVAFNISNGALYSCARCVFEGLAGNEGHGFSRDIVATRRSGDWGMGDETGQMERAGPDSGDFHVDKDWYAGVDDRCEILKVEKQAENL